MAKEDNKVPTRNLAEFLWAEIIVSVVAVILHTLLYMSVITNQNYFIAFPIGHGLAIALYIFIIYLWSSGQVDCNSFSLYFHYVSVDTIEDYFFTFGAVMACHAFFMAIAISLYVAEEPTYLFMLPTYGIGGAVMFLAVILSAKKPIKIKKEVDEEQSSSRLVEDRSSVVISNNPLKSSSSKPKEKENQPLLSNRKKK